MQVSISLLRISGQRFSEFTFDTNTNPDTDVAWDALRSAAGRGATFEPYKDGMLVKLRGATVFKVTVKHGDLLARKWTVRYFNGR